MRCLIMFIGLPGSGKSTLAKKIVERYSCDYFTSEIIGAQIDCYNSVEEDRDFSYKQQKEIYERLACDTLSSLQTQNVVVDGVFRSYHQRKMIDSIYQNVKETQKDLSYMKFWITCDEQIVIERIKKRKEKGTVSPAGVNAYAAISEQFEKPSEDEGFVIVDNSSSPDHAINRIIAYIENTVRSSQ